MKKNKEKFDNFAEFVLNDDKIVMKFLLTLAQWFGAIIFTALGLLFYVAEYRVPGYIFGTFALFAWYKLIKFYRMGGPKNLEGLTAAGTVWDKDSITIEKRDNNGEKEQ